MSRKLRPLSGRLATSACETVPAIWLRADSSTVAVPVTVTLSATASSLNAIGRSNAEPTVRFNRRVASENPWLRTMISYGPSLRYGNRKRPSASVDCGARDVGFGLTRGNLRAGDHGTLRVRDASADARVVDGLLCRSAGWRRAQPQDNRVTGSMAGASRQADKRHVKNSWTPPRRERTSSEMNDRGRFRRGGEGREERARRARRPAELWPARTPNLQDAPTRRASERRRRSTATSGGRADRREAERRNPGQPTSSAGRPGSLHRTDFPGMRALRAALMGGRASAGRGQRLLTAERCRNEDLHDHVAQHHGQAQRREVPSDGSHRLAEIILQTSVSRADLPQGLFPP